MTIKRLRELNEIASRHGYGEGQQTKSGRFVFTHAATGAQVFIGFNQTQYLKEFEGDLRRAIARAKNRGTK